MNVYEEAHALERAIKESEEYKQYKATKDKIDANEDLKKMMDDFHQKQLEVQTKAMMGEELTDEMQQSVQNLYQIGAADPLAAEYLQCEMRFQVMMQDVFNILGDTIKL